MACKSIASATVPMINQVMAMSIGLKLREVGGWRSLLGSKEIGAEPRTVVTSVMMRGLLLPGVHFVIVYFLLFRFLPADRLFRFVLFVSSMCPTASIVVILAHVAGLGELAKIAAFVITPQYLMAIPGLVVFLSAALYAIE